MQLEFSVFKIIKVGHQNVQNISHSLICLSPLMISEISDEGEDSRVY